MKETMKRYLLCALLVIAMTVLSCCAKKAEVGELDEVAASRGPEDVSDIVYIDENAIALAADAATTETAGTARAAFDLVNQTRVAAGLNALTWNPGLEQACYVRAQECQSLFSHTRPNGTDWWTVNSDLMWGENLAMHYYDANSAVNAWLASPTHRANIMSGFTSGAIAIHQASDGTWYWAQEFGY